MNAKEICQRIRTIRELRGINQSDIAEALGVTQSSYAKMEKGQTKISLNRFIQIVDFLESDPAFFFKEIEQSTQKTIKPYRQKPAPKSQWEESLGYNLYIVAKQNQELMGLLEGIKPKSA